jgi:hypothetical protein
LIVKLSLRTIAAGSFALSLLTAGLRANPSVAEEAGFDFWNVPTYHETMTTSEKEFRDADRKDTVVCRRTELKLAIAQDIVDGKLSFEEATVRFVELNRMHPPAMVSVHGVYSPTSDEAAARQVAAFVRATRKPGADQLADDWERALAAKSQ